MSDGERSRGQPDRAQAREEGAAAEPAAELVGEQAGEQAAVVLPVISPHLNQALLARYRATLVCPRSGRPSQLCSCGAARMGDVQLLVDPDTAYSALLHFGGDWGVATLVDPATPRRLYYLDLAGADA